MCTDDVPKGKVLIDIADAWEATNALSSYRRELLEYSKKLKKKGKTEEAEAFVARANLMIEIRDRIEDVLLEDSRAKAAREAESQG